MIFYIIKYLYLPSHISQFLTYIGLSVFATVTRYKRNLTNDVGFFFSVQANMLIIYPSN